MPLSPKHAQEGLTAINAAILALDHDAAGPHEADEIVNEALELLMSARGVLTDKVWPHLPKMDEATRLAWLDARAAEQREAGIQ